jgi:hypothetical protein
VAAETIITSDGDDHRGDHHPEAIGHPDGRDHRVEREHHVEQHDLDEHRPNDAGPRCRDAMARLALELVVDLVRGLPEQEQAAEDQDEVAAGDLVPETSKSGRVSPITHASENSRAMRVTIARPSPNAPRERPLALRQLVQRGSR